MCVFRNAEKKVVLEIQRASQSSSSLSSAAESKYSGPDGESDSHENEENIAPEHIYSTIQERRVSYKVSEYRRRECSYSAETVSGQWQPALSIITEETIHSETIQNQMVKSTATTRSTKWDPEISDIPRVESMRTFLQQSQSMHHMSMSTVNNDTWTPACSLVSEDDTRWRSEVDSQNSSSCDDVTTTKLYDTTDMTQDESQRQAAIEAVAECEDDFVNLMHCGIQMFSRPLRHFILSSSQHAAIFQNVEKLVAISEYLLKELQESETDFTSVTESLTSNLGAIFMPKVRHQNS